MIRVRSLTAGLAIGLTVAAGVTLAAQQPLGPAEVRVSAERGAATQNQQLRAPAPGRVTFVSDSALAGIRWSAQEHLLTNAVWDNHLESCRRLVFPSCRGREGIVPLTAEHEIRDHHLVHGPANPADIVVIGTGYNDWPERFQDDFQAVVGAARTAGFRQIVWLTYRDETSYQLPDDVRSQAANYSRMNEILFEQLATGAFPDVYLWDFRGFTAGHDDWFSADGVHITSDGVPHVAAWLSSHLTVESPPWHNVR